MFPRCLLAAALFVALVGCSRAKPSEPLVASGGMPDLPQGTQVGPGVLLSKVSVSTSKGAKQLWVYTPEKAAGKLPMVLIAPAGSPLIHGMNLGEGDMPEHLPYVRAGFVVVAYEIDGFLGENASDAETVRAAKEFRDANAGISNAKLALDYALAKLPVDPKRIYSAGHSSAGTLSLQVAENDSRLAGCIAYAPVADIPKRVGSEGANALDSAIPGFAAFLKDVSPVTQVDKLKCPAFLFHARDDSNVPFADAEEFAKLLESKNSQTTFETVATGDHYDSMIQVGIPKAIEWLKALKGK